MEQSSTISSAAPKRRRWLRVVVWVFAAFVVLLGVIYFVVTSSAFFKGVILPRVSKAIGASVTVADSSISPFSRVVLHDLKIQTSGNEPLFSVNELSAQYSLM